MALHLHQSVQVSESPDGAALDDTLHVHPGLDVGLGVVPDLAAPGAGDPILEVELFDDERLALMQVDGTRMGLGEDPALIHRANHLSALVEDRVRGATCGPDIDRSGRGSLPRPKEPTGSGAEPSFGHEIGRDLLDFGTKYLECLGRFERDLVGGASEMSCEDLGVARVDHRCLGWPFEECSRVVHEPLVESVLPGHQHRQRFVGGPPGSARLLTERGDRSGEPRHHRGVESADVDPQLQGIGSGYAE